MNAVILDLGDRHRTFPKSVQPGIPKLAELKPGWKRVKIGDLFRVVNRPCQLSDSETYRLVTVKRARGGIESRGDLKGSEIAVKSQFFIEDGDFLISKRQIVHGACAIVSEEFAGSIVSNEYAVLHCKPLLDLDFLRQLIHSIYFQETCFHSSLGVHVEKMIFSTPEWFKWKIDIPEINEQRRIADFLGSIDERVKLLQRRRDALLQYKAGLMQRLFDQSLRFTRDDGTAFPDWEEKRLGEVLTIGSGRDYKHLDRGEVPVYGTGGYMTSVNDWLYDGESVCIGRKGTIDSPTFLTGKFWTVDTLFFTHKFIGVIPQFVFALFQRINWLKYNEASGVPSLSKSTIERIEIKIPNLDEQGKITGILGAIDDKISAVSAQVDKMQAFKNGLLQQIFA
jgi:type I restriction enzyme S subunit